MLINGLAVIWVLVAFWPDGKIAASPFKTEQECYAALVEQWPTNGADGMTCKELKFGIGPT